MEYLSPSTGEWLLRWTIRVAIALVLARVFVRFRRSGGVPSTAECWCWTLGCAAYACHVFLAFEFRHQWSHEHAWNHTAEETARVTGLRRGEGIWVNYLFTFVWTLDVVRLIAARYRGRATSRYMDRAIAAGFAFIIFNATVVFGPSFYRFLAVPVLLMMLFAWHRFRRDRHVAADSG